MPAMIRIRVVFPAPLAPSKPQTPGVSFRQMSSAAVLSRNRFVTWSSTNSIKNIPFTISSGKGAPALAQILYQKQERLFCV